MCPWDVLVMTHTGGATREDKRANLAVRLPARKDLPPPLFISPVYIPCQISIKYELNMYFKFVSNLYQIFIKYVSNICIKYLAVRLPARKDLPPPLFISPVYIPCQISIKYKSNLYSKNELNSYKYQIYLNI